MKLGLAGPCPQPVAAFRISPPASPEHPSTSNSAPLFLDASLGLLCLLNTPPPHRYGVVSTLDEVFDAPVLVKAFLRNNTYTHTACIMAGDDPAVGGDGEGGRGMMDWWLVGQAHDGADQQKFLWQRPPPPPPSLPLAPAITPAACYYPCKPPAQHLSPATPTQLLLYPLQHNITYSLPISDFSCYIIAICWCPLPQAAGQVARLDGVGTVYAGDQQMRCIRSQYGSAEDAMFSTDAVAPGRVLGGASAAELQAVGGV